MDNLEEVAIVTSTPPDITEVANETTFNLLPERSKKRYETAYQQFMEWREMNKAMSFSENVVIAYFTHLSKKYKSATLWSLYSMLRSTLSLRQNVNIANYFKLRCLLKKLSKGYQPKKSKTLTPEEISKFMNDAPDSKYLMHKVALAVGISGACRREDLCNLQLENIEDLKSAVIIKLPDTKTNISRSFTVTGNFYQIFKKYAELRPRDMPSNRFFVRYHNGKCSRQVVGINKFGEMCKEIATHLQLENPELYTGHCFRRSSATILVDAGADITTLKRHGGWKSTSVAEAYIDDSINNKMQIANKILKSVENTEQDIFEGNVPVLIPVALPSTSQTITLETINNNTKIKKTIEPTPFNISNCSDFKIEIHHHHHYHD